MEAGAVIRTPPKRKMTGRSPSVAIVGAGLGGSLMALYLARRGYRVDVYERRPDLRTEATPGPSMNLGLSRRGIDSLARVGLADAALARAIPMEGRVVHGADGELSFQPYGVRRGEVIQAIQRNDVNAVLIEAAAREPGTRFHFGRRLVQMDREGPELEVAAEDGAEPERVRADFVVGADGISSTVRHFVQRGERADLHREFLDWGWRELRIPPGPGGAFRMEVNAFHLWPRGGSMLFAHPNRDGSFTCSFVLPLEGPVSFATLAAADAVEAFFARTYPDLPELIPDLAEQFLANPTVLLGSVRTSRWFHRDRAVLLGDAAHAVVPFYAQGMNAAFEDCAVLDDCLGRHRDGDRDRAFADYQALRKPHTDALEDMSKRNFVELRDTVRSPWLRAKKRLDLALNRLLPGRWMPLHARVTHTTLPYAEAQELARRQDRILARTGAAVGSLLLLLALSRLRPDPRRPRKSRGPDHAP